MNEDDCSKRLLVITGANGYIGTELCALALARGWSVRALTRQRPELSAIDYVNYDLSRSLPAEALSGANAIVHLAAHTGSRATEVDQRAALQDLISSAPDHACLIFMSSQAASGSAPTSYGKIKAELEQLALANGVVVIRPGLVYGGRDAGLFRSLVRLVSLVPAVPAIRPPAYVQPVHVTDLAHAILAVAACSERGRSHNVAGPPMYFETFLKAIARVRFRKHLIAVPVPRSFILLGVLLLTPLRLLGFDVGRVRSLLNIRIVVDDSNRLGVLHRSVDQGLALRDERRRRLLREGRAMLSYVLGRHPRQGSLRRYVRLVEMREGEPMLMGGILPTPFLISLMDVPNGVISENLGDALRISETEIQSSSQMPRMLRFLRLIVVVGAEAIRIPVAALLQPILRVAMRNKRL